MSPITRKSVKELSVQEIDDLPVGRRTRRSIYFTLNEGETVISRRKSHSPVGTNKENVTTPKKNNKPSELNGGNLKPGQANLKDQEGTPKHLPRTRSSSTSKKLPNSVASKATSDNFSPQRNLRSRYIVSSCTPKRDSKFIRNLNQDLSESEISLNENGIESGNEITSMKSEDKKLSKIPEENSVKQVKNKISIIMIKEKLLKTMINELEYTEPTSDDDEVSRKDDADEVSRKDDADEVCRKDDDDRLDGEKHETCNKKTDNLKQSIMDVEEELIASKGRTESTFGERIINREKFEKGESSANNLDRKCEETSQEKGNILQECSETGQKKLNYYLREKRNCNMAINSKKENDAYKVQEDCEKCEVPRGGGSSKVHSEHSSSEVLSGDISNKLCQGNMSQIFCKGDSSKVLSENDCSDLKGDSSEEHREDAGKVHHKDNASEEHHKHDASEKRCEDDATEVCHEDMEEEEEDMEKEKKDIGEEKEDVGVCRKDDADEVCHKDDADEVCRKDDADEVCPKDDAHEVCPKDDADEVSRKDDADEVCRKDDADEVCRKDDADEVCRKDDADEVCRKDDADEVCRKDDADEVCRKDDADKVGRKDDADEGRRQDDADEGRRQDDADEGRRKDDEVRREDDAGEDHRKNDAGEDHRKNDAGEDHRNNDADEEHHKDVAVEVHRKEDDSETHRKEDDSETHRKEDDSETHRKEDDSETHRKEDDSETHRKEDDSETHRKEDDSETHRKDDANDEDDSETHRKEDDSETHREDDANEMQSEADASEHHGKDITGEIHHKGKCNEMQKEDHGNETDGVDVGREIQPEDNVSEVHIKTNKFHQIIANGHLRCDDVNEVHTEESTEDYDEHCIENVMNSTVSDSEDEFNYPPSAQRCSKKYVIDCPEKLAGEKINAIDETFVPKKDMTRKKKGANCVFSDVNMEGEREQSNTLIVQRKKDIDNANEEGNMIKEGVKGDAGNRHCRTTESRIDNKSCKTRKIAKDAVNVDISEKCFDKEVAKRKKIDNKEKEEEMEGKEEEDAEKVKKDMEEEEEDMEKEKKDIVEEEEDGEEEKENTEEDTEGEEDMDEEEEETDNRRKKKNRALQFIDFEAEEEEEEDVEEEEENTEEDTEGEEDMDEEEEETDNRRKKKNRALQFIDFEAEEEEIYFENDEEECEEEEEDDDDDDDDNSESESEKDSTDINIRDYARKFLNDEAIDENWHKRKRKRIVIESDEEVENTSQKEFSAHNKSTSSVEDTKEKLINDSSRCIEEKIESNPAFLYDGSKETENIVTECLNVLEVCDNDEKVNENVFSTITFDEQADESIPKLSVVEQDEVQERVLESSCGSFFSNDSKVGVRKMKVTVGIDETKQDKGDNSLGEEILKNTKIREMKYNDCDTKGKEGLETTKQDSVDALKTDLILSKNIGETKSKKKSKGNKECALSLEVQEDYKTSDKMLTNHEKADKERAPENKQKQKGTDIITSKASDNKMGKRSKNTSVDSIDDYKKFKRESSKSEVMEETSKKCVKETEIVVCNEGTQSNEKDKCHITEKLDTKILEIKVYDENLNKNEAVVPTAADLMQKERLVSEKSIKMGEEKKLKKRKKEYAPVSDVLKSKTPDKMLTSPEKTEKQIIPMKKQKLMESNVDDITTFGKKIAFKNMGEWLVHEKLVMQNGKLKNTLEETSTSKSAPSSWEVKNKFLVDSIKNESNQQLPGKFNFFEESGRKGAKRKRTKRDNRIAEFVANSNQWIVTNISRKESKKVSVGVWDIKEIKKRKLEETCVWNDSIWVVSEIDVPLNCEWIVTDNVRQEKETLLTSSGLGKNSVVCDKSKMKNNIPVVCCSGEWNVKDLRQHLKLHKNVF